MDLGILLIIIMTLLIVIPFTLQIINEEKYKEEIDELINEEMNETK